MTHPETRAARTTKLVRELGLLDATMIVMGSMIGSGIFLTSAESARLVGAPGWLLVAWLLSGLLTVTGSLCCAELAAMMPRAGGQYVFLRVAYGRLFGFLFGWSLFLVVQTGTIAAVAVAFARFLGVFTGAVASNRYIIAPRVFGHYAVSLSTQQLVALGLIVVLTATNTRGLRIGKLIQNSFTITKTAALFGLIVLGLTLGINRESAAWTSSWWNSPANGWDPRVVQDGLRVSGTAALMLLLGQSAVIGPLFSQSAWNNVTFTGGEVREPDRTLPRALVLGCGSVVALYLLANVAYVVTLSLKEIQQADQDRVGTAVMAKIFGPAGTSVMAGAILISTFGCLNGLILAGARGVYYAMARDGPSSSPLAGTTKSAPRAGRRHGPAAGGMGRIVDAAGHGLDRQALRCQEVRQPLQRTAGVYHPGRPLLLCADGRCGHPPAAQGAWPEAAVSNARVPGPCPDLHRSGRLARARLRLPRPRHLGERIRDRAGGHSRVFYLVPQGSAGTDWCRIELTGAR